jgi:hypothetical protein
MQLDYQVKAAENYREQWTIMENSRKQWKTTENHDFAPILKETDGIKHRRRLKSTLPVYGL